MTSKISIRAVIVRHSKKMSLGLTDCVIYRYARIHPTPLFSLSKALSKPLVLLCVVVFEPSVVRLVEIDAIRFAVFAPSGACSVVFALPG